MKTKALGMLAMLAIFPLPSALGGYVPLVRLVVTPQEYVNSDVRTVGFADVIDGDFGIAVLRLFVSREQAELGIDGIHCSFTVNRKREELMQVVGKWVMVEGRFMGPERKHPAPPISYEIINVESVEIFQPLGRSYRAEVQGREDDSCGAKK